MATDVQTNEPQQLGPWPKGVNNRLRASELSKEELVDALNLDITNTGRVLRRSGSVRVYSGDVHSLVAAHRRLYWVEGGQLYRNTSSPVVVDAGPISLPLSYVLINNELWWSNIARSGRVVDGATPTNYPWVPTTPPTPAVVATTPGQMYAGRYLVTCTYEFADFREGGAPVPAVISLAADQAIRVTLPQPPQPEVVNVRVYVSDPNGEQMYFEGKYPVGITFATIQRAHRGRMLETLLMDPMPSGSIIAQLDGRNYSVRGNIVWFSHPFRFGLMHAASNYIMFPSDVKIFLPCVDGIWIVADQVYWWDDRDPKKGKLVVQSEDDAVPGTGVILPRDQGVAWFGERGWMLGEAGGKLSAAMDAQVAVNKYAQGAALFREQRGIRQVVSSLQQEGIQTKFAASDYMDAEIVRKKP